MSSILDNRRFLEVYHRLSAVTLNPRRHTASDAKDHSESVAHLAAKLGEANSCSADELRLLVDLGRAHDIGKITGTARPERSLEVLHECSVSDRDLLSLVKWHDVGLPWFHAENRGQSPTDKAWRRLANEVNMKLLCIFMVADRVDAPGGWRSNPPTVWFLGEAHRRGLVRELKLDLSDHPSSRSAGGTVLSDTEGAPKLLMIRLHDQRLVFPSGPIQWDETLEEASCRQIRARAGVEGDLKVRCHLGNLQCFGEDGGNRYLKDVRYYLVLPDGWLEMAGLPEGVEDRVWIGLEEAQSSELVEGALHPLLAVAFNQP